VAPDRFVAAAVTHRVLGVLGASGNPAGLPAAVLRPLHRPALVAAGAGLALARGTALAWQALRDAGVPCLVLKGAALAALSTGRCEVRGGGDIDLLVDPIHMPAAHRALTAAGWYPSPGKTVDPGPGAGWAWTRFSSRERTYVGPNHDIDLHWRIGHGTAVFPPASVLIDRATTVDLAGVPVTSLAVPDALLATCYHARYDELSSLRYLVDVARLNRLAAGSPPAGLGRSGRRLVREVTGFVEELLGPEDRMPLPAGPSARARRMAALWCEGSPWGIDEQRRNGPRTSPWDLALPRKFVRLGRSLELERSVSSWIRILGFTALPGHVLVDGTRPLSGAEVFRRGTVRAALRCRSAVGRPHRNDLPRVDHHG
jgi:hypothetical protein